MDFIFIDKNSTYYNDAIKLRILVFFKGMDHAKAIINDTYEHKSQHVVCLHDKEVVGTGRLTIENKQGISSQMAIKQEFQKQGIGSGILLKILDKCSRMQLDSLQLSARKTAIDFYKKYGFETHGSYYESEKTGIVHQQMNKAC